MNDLLANIKNDTVDTQYTAQDIEVLEGLEPVRRRPGMYIGGTDERALHHLVAEVLDNSMDEAVAGHASRIEIEMLEDGGIRITDNGRGIPIGKHPKFPDKTALEVILTTLHSGGKFSNKSYSTSGGLHGVGVSVVNALSEKLVVEIARDRKLYRQTYSKGAPQDKLEDLGSTNNRRGTSILFYPDTEIFDEQATFSPIKLYKMARSKAYLFRGVEIRWSCAESLIDPESEVPVQETLTFPNGLLDFLEAQIGEREQITATVFSGIAEFPGNAGKVEWAIAWPDDENGFNSTYCNTIPTPQGGTHESGFRSALTKSMRSYGDMINEKGIDKVTTEDALAGAMMVLSVFIPQPQFQGQTKEKLTSREATRLVENAVRDPFDLWLAASPKESQKLLERVIARAEERQRRRSLKSDTIRKSTARRLRLPGKLADCSKNTAEGTEIFIVEGDSAGGSAKQGRNRQTQAILPLRGKILNVASATKQKMMANQEIKNVMTALGCGIGPDFKLEDVRYEKVIIMTDADVDGAHIAALLMTFFYTQMRPLIEAGRLFIAIPPLYRLAQGSTILYAQDDAHKDELIDKHMKKDRKIDISRFKGLGEMPAAQLKETTMNPENRILMRVTIKQAEDATNAFELTDDLINRLMGRNADARFQFIQDNAEFAKDLDI